MANLDLCAGSVDPIYPPGPGRMVTVIPLEITENGTYTAPNGYAYSPITADVVSASPNDVTFYDYDGTVIAGYTAEQFADLTALPSNPTHDGLVAHGWNWSMEDAKAYVAKYGKLNVGQMYTTDDGKTRLYFNRLVSGNTLSITLTPTVADGVTIDWGDGSTTVTDSAEQKAYEHTYSAEITPVVTIDVTDGSATLGEYGRTKTWLRKAEIGNGIVAISNGAFNGCASLASITIPNSVTSFGSMTCGACQSLAFVVLPNSITSIGSNVFSNCHALESVVIPNSVTSIESGVFSSCYDLDNVTLPEGISSIPQTAFAPCDRLTSMIIPESVTSIGGGAFGGCSSMREYYVYPKTPPILNSPIETSFQNILIKVPAESLNAYKTASRWSDLADHIVAM